MIHKRSCVHSPPASGPCKACLHSDLRETSLLQWFCLSPLGPCRQKGHSKRLQFLKRLDLSPDPLMSISLYLVYSRILIILVFGWKNFDCDEVAFLVCNIKVLFSLWSLLRSFWFSFTLLEDILQYVSQVHAVLCLSLRFSSGLRMWNNCKPCKTFLPDFYEILF